MTISRIRNEIQKRELFMISRSTSATVHLSSCYDRMGNWLKFKPFKVHLTVFPHLKNNTGTRPKTVDESSRWIQCQPVVRTCWKVRSFSASLIGSGGRECKREKMAKYKNQRCWADEFMPPHSSPHSAANKQELSEKSFLISGGNRWSESPPQLQHSMKLFRELTALERCEMKWWLNYEIVCHSPLCFKQFLFYYFFRTCCKSAEWFGKCRRRKKYRE